MATAAATSPPCAPPAQRILVIEDETSMCELLGILLQKDGYEVESASTLQEAEPLLTDGVWDLVVTDLWLDQVKDGGIRVLRRLQEVSPGTPTLVITAHGSVNSAIDAMKLGAFDYLIKPFNNDELRLMVQKALEQSALRRENRQLANQLRRINDLDNIIGNSAAMLEVKDMIRRVGALSSTVLILGESGTGKELVARAIHGCSPRTGNAFLSINCGGLPDSLLESELFGHAKGSFTGAVTDKVGMFQAAHSGTLFLDEIGETSPPLQVKLLRTLSEMMIRPVGTNEEIRVDVRLISATNRDLDHMVETGEFREDFFYRLNVIPIQLPPLRERRDDIPLLAHHFVHRYSARLAKPVEGLAEDALDALTQYQWPGNIREFENIIERTIALCNGPTITADDLPGHLTRPAVLGGRRETDLPPEGIDLEHKVAQFERSLLAQALTMANQSQVNAAKLLGLSPRSLRYKLEKYSMKP